MRWPVLNNPPAIILFAEHQTKDLTIVASDRQPPITNYPIELDYYGYRRCGQFVGEADNIPTNLTCADQAIGRYVYAYIPRSTYLAICELEAYGTREYIPVTTRLLSIERADWPK